MRFEEEGELISDAKTQKDPRWDEKIPWFELPDDNEPHAYRLVAAPYYFSMHWIPTFKKDGKPGKAFPAICANFDHKTNTYADNGCEVCEYLRQLNAALDETKQEWSKLPAHITKMTKRLTMASNVIIRELQEQGPPANNQNWSYIKQVRFPQGFAKTLKELQDKFNKVENKVYALNHMQYGKDLYVSFNSASEDKNKIYTVQLGNTTALTDAEKACAGQLVDFQAHMRYPDQRGLSESLKRNGLYEWLENFRSTSNIPSVARAPRTAAEGSTSSAKFESGDAVPADPEPARPAQPVTPPAQPSVTAAAAAVAVAAVVAAAPAPAAPVAPPVAPAAVVQPATPAQPAAAPVVSSASAVEGRLQDFSTQTGVPLAVSGAVYQKPLKLYNPTLAVPTCWASYNQTIRANKDLCKACPLRLDCMLVSAKVA